MHIKPLKQYNKLNIHPDKLLSLLFIVILQPQIMKRTQHILYILLFGMLMASCSEYQLLLKSNDYNLKYEKAKEYYASEDYAKAATLLQEVVPILKGTSFAEESLYLQAMTYFRQGDYVYAEHFFNQIIRTYPRNVNIQDCYFNRAYCFYMQSPRAKLDQSTSRQAIDAFGLFMDLYPNTAEAEEAQAYIDEMQDKLAYKAYMSAKLYYDLGTYLGNNYQSAIITAENCLKEFPSTKHREELSFLILDSRYIIAENSIDEKQSERYRAVIDEYYNFLNDFPESKMKKEADEIYNKTQKLLNWHRP